MRDGFIKKLKNKLYYNIMEFNWTDDTWKVAEKPFDDPDFLIYNQLKSFNNLMTDTLPRLIQLNMPITVTQSESVFYKVTITRVYVSRPVQHNTDTGYQPLLPHEARIRDLTYAGPVFVDYTQEFQNGHDHKVEHVQKVPLGKIPIMVGSRFCHLYGKTPEERVKMGECAYDRGGYFIVNGSEKVVVAQERPVDNKIMYFKEGSSSTNAYEAQAEIKSTIDQRFYPIKKAAVYLTRAKSNAKTKADATHIPGKKLEVLVPHIKAPKSKSGIPLFIVFRALGVVCDKDIFENILGDTETASNEMINLLIPSAMDSAQVTTQLDAITYIAHNVNYNPPTGLTPEEEHTKKLQYTKDIINREFLAGVGQDNLKKARFLARMTRGLLNAVIDPNLFSDRDHYSNKRVDGTGPLMSQILRYNLASLIRDIKKSCVKELEDPTGGVRGLNPNLRKIIQKCTIESRIKYALSTGNWHTSRAQANLEGKKGIAQVMQRLSWMGAVGHLRRVQSPLERAGSKHEPPRRYHATQLGKICPNETPEGQQVGIVKNLSMLCHITIDCSAYPVKWILSKLGVTDICKANPKIIPQSTAVLVNGDFIGIIDKREADTAKIYAALKMFKLNGKISEYTSIAWFIETNELVIQTDGGRYCRPVYVVDKNCRFKIDHWVKDLTETDKNKFFEDLTWDNLKRGLDSETISETSGAMIEYLDTNEDECSLIAIIPQQLIPGRVHTLNPDGTIYAKMGHVGSRFKLGDAKTPEQVHTYIGSLLDDRYRELWTGVDVLDIVNHEESTIMLKIPTDAPEHLVAFATNINKFVYSDYLRYTHCEIHAAMWHSVVAQMIPFPDHNQSPRNCYQSSMGKQALGIFATNYAIRVDTMANILTYPQKPLVQTRTTSFTALDKLPHGYQAIVAIACFSGYNQEDSVLVSEGAIERGMFNSVYYRTYTNKLQKHKTANTAQETFGIPPYSKTIGRRVGTGGHNRYHAVDKVSGKPIVGAYVEQNDILISKYKKAAGSGTQVLFDDASTLVKEAGIIDMIIPNQQFPNNENAEGYQFVKARISNLRIPIIGDKLASRSAQKGTIGMIYASEDMPCTKDGIVPDIIMNPHAIPSRMTIAQLIEAVLGKAAVMSGRTRDATPFTHFKMSDVKSELAQYGFDHNGNEMMYNGQTGEMFEAAIFINPTYYQRLKHMVDDKVHCLTMDHEVLTDKGWKFFGDITMSDRIATLSEGKIVYDHPTGLLHYPDYEGKMYHIETPEISLNVTENHRMYVSKTGTDWELSMARDIVGPHHYKRDAEWDAPDYQFVLPRYIDGKGVVYPEIVVNMDAWLTYFGIWKRGGLCPDSEDLVRTALDQLGFCYLIDEDKIHIRNVQLNSYLSSLGETFPEWVWSLSTRQAVKLLESMTVESDDEYFVTSELSAGDMMRLCLHAGWSATKSIDGKLWRLQINRKENTPIATLQDPYEFKGEVFCLQVPSEVFYVRRNGKSAWTGNSRDIGPIQMMTRQPTDGRSRGGGLRVGEMERDCFIAHGAPQYQKEKMNESSDLFRLYVSRDTGAIVAANPELGVYRNGLEEIYENEEVVPVNMPFAASLLLNEMKTILIDTILTTD